MIDLEAIRKRNEPRRCMDVQAVCDLDAAIDDIETLIAEVKRLQAVVACRSWAVDEEFPQAAGIDFLGKNDGACAVCLKKTSVHLVSRMSGHVRFLACDECDAGHFWPGSNFIIQAP